MATITSGTGLISGLDIESLVTKLMAIEKKQVTTLETRNETLESQKSALETVSAQLLSMKVSCTTLKSGVNFRKNTASSSNESVLTATANATTAAGSYSFRVRQLAQANQQISSGFSSKTSSVGTGTITMELGQGQLDRDVELNTLNGNAGVRRGTIKITDRSGASTTIDLSSAVTIGDVLKEINDSEDVGVAATVKNGQIVITDTTGMTTSALKIENGKNSYAATDLGIVGSTSSSSQLIGSDVVKLSLSSDLAQLNDGSGVRTNRNGTADLSFALADGSSYSIDLGDSMTATTPLELLNRGQGVAAGSILVTDRTGVSTTVDLSAASTVGDVLSAINSSTGGKVTASVVGSTIMLTDKTTGTGSLQIADVGESTTATDLGLVGKSTSGSASFTGERVFQSISTLNDVARLIEDGTDGKVTVSIAADGKRLQLVDTTTGSNAFAVESVNDSHSAEDLGIAGTSTSNTLSGDRIIAGLNTVLIRSLNGGTGGTGTTKGAITIQDRTGASATFDFSNAETLDDIISTINESSAVNVEARLNDAGNGLVIEDKTGATTENFQIAGAMAESLGIAIDGATTVSGNKNLQLQYVSENTKLSDLNGGKGIPNGSFAITNSQGKQVTFKLNDTSAMTLGDLMDKINGSSAKVKASINATGDGLLLTDQAGGTSTLKVSDVGSGGTASKLRIAGTASTTGAGTIDGSYEYKITIAAGDTLEDLVERVNDLGAPVSAAVIYDGSTTNGYRLSLTSSQTGNDGEMFLDMGTTGMSMVTLTEAQDAVVSYGTNTNSPIVATSSSNTFKNLVNGLQLTAASVSDSPVTVTVARDTASITEAISKFVEDFNTVIDTIATATDYDSEAGTKGVLLGNSTIESVRTRMYNAVRKTLSDVGDFKRLSEIGVKIGTDAKLEFDEEKFASAYESDPTAVEELFSTYDKDAYSAAVAKGDTEVANFYKTTTMGFAWVIDHMIDTLTDDSGTITKATDAYDTRMDLISDRIEYLNELLEKKELRLYNQFYAMEEALAKMQDMSTALDSLSTLSSNSSSSSDSSSSSSSS